MAAPIETELRNMPLAVPDFWDLYAESDFLTLQRDPSSGVTGTCYVDKNNAPAMLIGEEKQFSVKREDLLRFHYRDEPMFSLGVHAELADALTAIISMPLMEKESIPGRDQLGLVLWLLEQTAPAEEAPYADLRQRVLSSLKDSKIPIDKAAALMKELTPGEKEYELYDATGMVGILNAEREILLKAYAFCVTDPEISKQIRAVIANHEHEDAITVQTAIWALGRHNDKDSIDSLIGLFGKEDFEYHRITIQEALQFLYSGRELIPTTGESERKYWRDHKQRLPDSPAAWAEHDAQSVFWEKRLRAAARWRAESETVRLEKLKSDEVLPVRLAAGGPERLATQE